MPYISLRAYSRRRGVALSAVQKAIDTRRVHGAAIREEGERITGIDPELADAQWAANTDPVEALRAGKIPGAVDPASPANVVAAVDPEKPDAEKQAPAAEGTAKDSFLAARIREAELRGELLELDKLKQLGALAPWEEVEAEYGEIFTQLKSAAFRIADRKAQVLAAETDPVRIQRLLTEELRAVFDEFSRRLSEAGPAGLAGQPAVAAASEAALS